MTRQTEGSSVTKAAKMMAEDEIERLDPETEYLMSTRRAGNEWEMFKENVRPLKRGRNINLLNTALNAHNHNRLKKSLLDNRRSSCFTFYMIVYL